MYKANSPKLKSKNNFKKQEENECSPFSKQLSHFRAYQE